MENNKRNLISEAKNSKELIRGLTLTAGIMIVAGSMIGSGIFRKPATMAGQLLSPELLILVWIVAGLFTFLGALANAEVASMYDKTGGQYLYFRDMYGDFTAYTFGWATIAVVLSGSQAAIAYVFAEYVGYFFVYPETSETLKSISFYIPLVGNIFPFNDLTTKMVAISCILFITFINYIGVIFGGTVQTVITFIKIFTIVALGFLLFILGNGDMGNIYHNFEMQPDFSGNFIALIGLALAGAFWAYDGWNNITYVSGEMKNPKRNVPLSLLWGTLIVVGLYVFINIAYLYLIPIEEMKNSPLVAATAMEKIFGKSGGAIISLAVIVSTFGALNGSILGAARVQYAMARTNLFFPFLGKVHPRFSTPHTSIVMTGVWSALLVMSGTFDTISDYVVFAAWLFYMLGAFGVIILRKKFPERERKYKVWGYPYTPIAFVIFSFLFLLNTVISDTNNAMMGFFLILIGLPIYFYRKYLNK
ncbi:MAG: APC family permease [Ignavibacteriaceae bacterium]